MSGIVANPWLAALILMMPPLAVALALSLRGDVNNRLVANQLAGALAVLSLAMMSFAFDQPATIDLALGLALIAIPGTYVFAIATERWL